MALTLIILGLALVFYCLEIRRLTGSLYLTNRSVHKLCCSGPYRFVRHPVTIGMILIVLGLALLWESFYALIVALMISAFLVIFAMLYVEKIQSSSEEDYLKYRKLVPSFIPQFSRKYPFEHSTCISWQFMLVSHVLKLLIVILAPTRVINRRAVTENVPVALAIIHQSHYDGPLVFYAMNRYFRFIGTNLVFEKVPLLRGMGVIPVKRYKVDMAPMRELIKTVRSGYSIGIAPEAGRTWDGKPICIRAEIWKLLKILNVPVVPVKFYGIQRLWPRWADKPSFFGLPEVEFFDPISPDDPLIKEKLEKAFNKTDPSFEKPYRDYRGISRLLWRCPKCGAIGSIRGRKRAVECKECDLKWLKPSVDFIISAHRKILPDNMKVQFPVEDTVTYNGEECYARIYPTYATIGDFKLEFDRIRRSSIELNHENIFGTESSEPVRFIPSFSALMWKEIIDYQVRFELLKGDYHTYYWDDVEPEKKDS